MTAVLSADGNRIRNRKSHRAAQTFQSLLENLGVDRKRAAADACRIEHAVSPESTKAPRRWQREELGGRVRSDAIQSFFCGFGFHCVWHIEILGSGVKAAMKKIIKKADKTVMDQQKAHRHGS